MGSVLISDLVPFHACGYNVQRKRCRKIIRCIAKEKTRKMYIELRKSKSMYYKEKETKDRMDK